MDNQINTSEPASREPAEPVAQEPIVPETPPEPELPPSEPEITEPQPETTSSEPASPEPAEGPSNEYQQVLNQYAAHTETVNTEPAEVPAQSPEEQLQNLGISSPPKTDGSFFKTLFNISLVVFVIVLLGLGFVYFKNQKNSSTIDDQQSTTKATPTSTGTCLLNDVTYQIGKSFVAADGCNTCTCESQDIISCTDKACVTPTSSATKSATITPTKIITPTKTITPTSTSSATK